MQVRMPCELVGPAALFFYSPDGSIRIRGMLRDDGIESDDEDEEQGEGEGEQAEVRGRGRGEEGEGKGQGQEERQLKESEARDDK